jgi:hypothetical protein
MQVSEIHGLTAVPWGNSFQYPLNMRFHGPQRSHGQFKQEKKLLPTAGKESRFLGYRVRSLFTTLAELPRQYTVRSYKYKVYKQRKLNIHLRYSYM